MKLLLILPKTNKSFLGGVSSSGKAGLARITLSTIASLTPKDIDVSIVDARVTEVDSNMDADLVGITALTAEIPSAFKIADNFRSRGIKVVMGGVHVSALPEEALEHVDSVVVGEAERVWGQLIEDFRNNKLKPVYKSDTLIDMKGMAVPDRSLLDYNMYTSFSTVQASRGCPFKCDFCTVTNFFGNQYRCRPVDEVIEEIKGLPDKNIFFMDDNIVGRPKFGKKLMKELVPLDITWGSQASITMADDDELLSLYSESGGRYVMIGFESVSQDNLQEVNKAWNKPQDYEKAIKKIHKAGIDIIGSFILGLEHDNVSSFRTLLDFTLKSKIDVALFYVLTPFPGTRLYERLDKEERIFDRDWSKYHTGEVVFEPKLMTAAELQNGYYWLLKEFYSYKNIMKRVFKTHRNILSRASLNYSHRRKAMKLPCPDLSLIKNK